MFIQLKLDIDTELAHKATIDELMPMARLISHLPIGEENAIFQKELARMEKMSVRDYQNLLNETCKHGWWNICTTNKGVFLAETDDEILKSFKRKYNIAIDLLERLHPTREYLKTKGLL